jgi:hypothetical protein
MDVWARLTLLWCQAKQTTTIHQPTLILASLDIPTTTPTTDTDNNNPAMRETSPDVEVPHVYGALSHIKRKTGEVSTHLPLDTTRVTLGRETGCDIRLYFEEVSKLHAEILFDEESGLVSSATCGS